MQENEVTQADREAAAELYLMFPALSSSPEAAAKSAQFIMDGGADGWNSVRLMAVHRQQAERPEPHRPVSRLPPAEDAT